MACRQGFVEHALRSGTTAGGAHLLLGKSGPIVPDQLPMNALPSIYQQPPTQVGMPQDLLCQALPSSPVSSRHQTNAETIGVPESRHRLHPLRWHSHGIPTGAEKPWHLPLWKRRWMPLEPRYLLGSAHPVPRNRSCPALCCRAASATLCLSAAALLLKQEIDGGGP